MRCSTAKSVSLWMTTERLPESPALPIDQRADVCVVGAGIAGLSTAYLLSREGRSVIVVDAQGVAAGQTQRTTAHLSNAIDDRYTEIERIHGEDAARLAADSHTAAIDRIEATVACEAIDCDFERLDGFLVPGKGQDAEIILNEHGAARRAGLTGVDLLERAPLATFPGPCLRFPRQAQFHPLRYLSGLVTAIRRNGGRIYGGTRVKSVEDGMPARVHTEAGPVITADAVVVATNSPINDLVAMHTKQHPYRTYVVGARLPMGWAPHALIWDTLDPYHYVRVQKATAGEADDFLIVGGEDHRTGQADDMGTRYHRLEAWAREHYPMVGNFDFHWSGQVLETVDGLAFIGRNPLDRNNVFIATGDSGEGMIHGTIAGALLTDLIQGRENPWTSLYDPSRKRVGALKKMVKEDANMALQYADWVTPGEVKSLEELAPGCGAVLRRGLGKVAVYRDEQGKLHERSATCPHLGAVVRWNPSEKCWDCPAHGSQFDRFGCVLNGPANASLRPAQEPECPRPPRQETVTHRLVSTPVRLWRQLTHLFQRHPTM